MKRTVVVLTMLLALTLTLCGDALAKITPDNYVDPSILKVRDEDHPWGGDQNNGGGSSDSDSYKDYFKDFSTNLDLGSFGLIFKMWLYRQYQPEIYDKSTTIDQGTLTLDSPTTTTLGNQSSR